jgi:hypothetical protein
MPQDYASMKLDQQVALVQAELPVTDALTSKAEMWRQAKTEIDEASTSLTRTTDQLEPAWTDKAGDQFAKKNRNAVRNLDTWSRNIQVNDPPKALGDLSAKIVQTATNVINNYNAAQQEISQIVAVTQADFDARKKEIEEKYQKLNATELTALDTEYDNTAAKITAAAAGGDWEQAPKPGQDGGSKNTTTPTSPTTNAKTGADQSQPANNMMAQDQQPVPTPEQQTGQPEQALTAEQGLDNGAPQTSGATDDPSLSGGLGSAPIAPPSYTPTPLPSTTVPSAGMLPFAPVAGLGGLGGGVHGGGGGGVRAPGGGGVRVPGVGVGSPTIPTAASPVSGAATPVQAAAPGLSGTTPSAGGPGGPGGMPMMPPMGMGAGAGVGGGSGGGPGSGAVQRPGNGRRRQGDSTAGMPPALRGKAGKADPHSFTTRSRTAESDIPTTVQLIDEDLWQVDGTAQAAEPVRRARR